LPPESLSGLNRSGPCATLDHGMKLADDGSRARNFAGRGLTGSLILNGAPQRPSNLK